MENGEYKVSLDTLFRILTVFGMEIGDFFREQAPVAGPSDSEHEMLRLMNRLDDATRAEILDYVRYKSTRRTETWKK
jgi:transcriptional regulator with XRE-family HTH domain